MDAICGLTMEMLAELQARQSELSTKHGQARGRQEFERLLASRGIREEDFSRAHNGWHARWRSDPTGRLEAEFWALQQRHARAVHFADVRDMSQDTKEGVSLDLYAKLCVETAKPGADPHALALAHGLQGVDHWLRVNAAWQAEMAKDTTHKLTTQFGDLYGKYMGPEAMQQQLVDCIVQGRENASTVVEPSQPITPQLCVEKLASPDPKVRYEYAYLYGNLIELNNVPDKRAALAQVTPVLIEMLERASGAAIGDAERALRKLWDLEVRTDDVRGTAIRCLNRAKDDYGTLQAAFAPIRDKAVPERVHLQADIEAHEQAIRTLEEFLQQEWRGDEPETTTTFETGPSAPAMRAPNRAKFVVLAAPLALAAIVAGAFVATRSQATAALATTTTTSGEPSAKESSGRPFTRASETKAVDTKAKDGAKAKGRSGKK